MKNTFPFFFFRFLTLVVLWQGAGLVFSQTTLISPTVNNGGFESGLTSWTKVDATGLNRWYVSGVSGPFAGSNAAFISNTGGATYNYDITSISTSHLYQDVSVPAGEIVGSLSFQLKGSGEVGWDRLLVYVAPTTVTPAPNVPASNSTVLTGATLVFTQTAFFASYTLQTVAIDLSPYAGSTVRLIFTWQSDNTIGTNPPASIDNITFTSAAPVTYTATALGGLWNSPDTWVGGVVPPPGNDIVIPAGSVVICNQVLNYRDITINGRLQFTTVTTSAPIHTVTRDLIVGPTGFLYCSNAAASLNQINIGRDLINNGTINAVTGVFAFNGNGNSQITGTGTFVGTGGRGVIRGLLAVNNGTFTLNQTQDITVTQQLNNTCNNFITNGKLRIDNAVDVFHDFVSQAIVSAMGSGYTTPPVVFGASVSPWTANGTATANTRYYVGNNVYLCVTGGTFGSSPPVNTTPVTETNGTATVLWIGNLGNIGNPFQITAVTAGTQYFCGDNLYTCTVAGTPSASAPPTHTSGVATSGTAQFAYVGSVAKVSLNYDPVTQTVRSANVVSTGSGYSSIPSIVVTNTGAGSGATISAVMFQSAGPANSLALKATASVFTGSADPRHSTAPAGAAGNGVYSATVASYGWYNSPVAIGFSPPTIANLVTSQGSGYTSAPTVTVSGGTLLSGTAITSSDFQVNVAGGRVISVYYIGPASKIYSVPPTITLTGGGGSGATISWGTAWPTATVNLSNGTSGYITGITITNPGYGYATAPSVGLRAPVAGEVAASSPSCRLQQLNIQWGFFLPQTTNPNNSSIMALVPSHNRVNAIAVSSGAQTFTSNLEVTASAPLPTFAGIIDMGGNNLRFSHPTYVGTAGTVSAYVTNGSVELSLPGGTASATRTFPIGGGTGATAHFVHVTGAGTVATGYTYTGMRVQRFSNPSGSVSPAGNITGIRGVRVDLTGVGALNNLNSTRTMQMFWNVLDNLVSNNPSLFIADATSPSGPWTIRSTSTGTGALPATGNRTTATGAPGPYADNPTMYFAWVNNGFTPPPPLQYNVVRSTGITYQSIAPAPIGDGTGLNTTFSSGDDAVSPVINLNVPGNAFTFQGETVTGFVISTNGNIQLHTASAATTSTAFTNSFNDNALLNVIAPFWDDLTANPNTAAGASQNIFYKITGTAPNRTLVVEWLNFTTFGAAGPQLNFQVEMEEATGIIRINYGDIQLFNGTNDHRYSYSCGLKGRFASAYPQPGQVFALGYENSNYWSHTRTQAANLGANGLLMSPEPRSRYTFTPGPGYVLPPIPTITPPANDDVNNAEPITALGAFPNNIAWNVPDNKPRIYTTRGATTSPQPFCAGPSDAKDVWFSFVATEPNVTARIYASGGFIPRAQLLDNSLNTIDCQVGPKGGVVDVVGTGLTIGATYYVRVYHNQTGNPAIFTANNVVNGNVTGVSINDGGSGYSFATTGQILGNRFDVSGGGGVTFVGAATTQSGGAITGGQFDGGNDYTSVPTITVEDPDWALTGQFAIVIYAPPVNDNCSGAIALTGINTNTCTTGTNQVVNVSTAAATPSSEPLGTCTAGADDDLWYTFTATGNMTNIQVQGNGGFDPALQIWTGTSCTSKSPVTSPAGGCVNATGANGLENVNLTTTPGTTYWVRVYHAGTGFGGPLANFSICVRTPTPNCATGFSPVSGTTEVPGSLTLSWNADPFATGYDVYLSTNQADVNAQNPAALVSSNQPGTTYNATGLTAGATYYWRIVPRNVNGSATGCSTLSFTVGSNSCTFISYPQIFASSTADEEITNVTVGSMNNSSTCATVAPGFGSIQNRYSNYAGHVTPHTGIQGSTVNFSLTQTTCGGNFSNGFQMYIDWNEDGDFLDAGEQVYNQPVAATGNHTKTGTFVVPNTATPGTKRLRVVNVETTFPTTINYAHTAYTWGETEDYCFVVVAPTPCSGTPNPGSTTSNATTACNGQIVTLNFSNALPFTGLSYNWQFSTDGGATWTTFSTNPPPVNYTFGTQTTMFRCQVTCTNSGQTGISTPVTVNVGSACQCAPYCTPTYSSGNTFGDYINSVVLNPGGLINNTTGVNANVFTLYTSPNPSLVLGSNYTLNVQVGTYTFNDVKVWIDWNGNGTFEASEVIGEVYDIPANATATFNFTVPASATLGSTRIRVREADQGTTNMDPCVSYSFGETEDYCVTIAPPTCTWTGNVPAGPVWGHWTVAGNWDCGYVPTLTTNVIIPNVPIQPAIVMADGNAYNVTMHDGTKLLINNSNRRLNVANNFSAGTGTGAAINHSTGQVRMLASDGTGEMSGNANIHTLDIAAPGTGNVTITSGSIVVRNAVRLVSGTLNTMGNLTLEALNAPAHSAAIVDNFSAGFTGTMVGNVKAQRRVPRFGNMYLGSPVNNGTIADMAANIPGGLNHNGIGTDGSYYIADPTCSYASPASPLARIMQYDETAPTTCQFNGWQIRLTGTTQNGRGYLVMQPSATSNPFYQFTGIANTGNITTPITRTASNATATQGMNLLSNPYPSGINLDAFYAANSSEIGVVANLFNGTTFVPVQMNDGVPSLIASFQGFIVNKLTVGSGTVTFNQGMRVTGNTLAFTDAMNVPHKLEVEVVGSDAEHRDVTYVYFGEGVSDGFDLREDGYKYYSAEGYPTLYTLAEGTAWPVSVNGLNVQTRVSEVPVGLHPGAAGRFVFTLRGGDRLPAGLVCYLVDRKEQKEVRVGSETSYVFDINGAETRDRFVLKFRREVAVTEQAVVAPEVPQVKETVAGTEADRAWVSGGRVYLSLGRDVPGRLTLRLVDMSGKVVWTDAIQNAVRGVYDLGELDVAAGLYILNWSDGSGTQSARLPLGLAK